eukprot:3765073-Pyramimonas_sp.AAC.1
MHQGRGKAPKFITATAAGPEAQARPRGNPTSRAWRWCAKLLGDIVLLHRSANKRGGSYDAL